MKFKALFLVAVLSSVTFARADEIRFTTLPQPIQTTVIRETHIAGPAAVTRVIRESNGIYAVTVNADTGPRVVYVNDAGTIVQAPAASSTTSTTTVQRTEPSTTTTTIQRAEPVEEGSVVTYQQVQSDNSRYQLIEKKGNKEVYLDRQTGQKVKVKREDND